MEYQRYAQERRKALQPFCHVDKVKQHLRLELYYRSARQLFQQGSSYIEEKDWDNAYVYLKRLTSVCLDVIPEHNAFNQTLYKNEQAWLKKHAKIALELLQNIVQQMEEEDEDEDEFIECFQDELMHSTSSIPNQDSTNQSLSHRLNALKIQTPSLSTKPSEEIKMKYSKEEALNALRVEKSIEVKDLELNPPSSYPNVGKPSWMLPDQHKPYIKKKQSYQKRSLKEGLRKIIIPSSVIHLFTCIAKENTMKPPCGIETCGILAGCIMGDHLQISTLVIPKQTASSDMCTMINEEELFDYCISNDLLTLGWIHTHPSQSCFLSSIDLHTHCGFQSMLPEAIAIVISPRDHKKSVGVFRLNAPHGLELIQNCTLSGFHPHSKHIEIYSDASECIWKEESICKVEDLRNK